MNFRTDTTQPIRWPNTNAAELIRQVAEVILNSNQQDTDAVLRHVVQQLLLESALSDVFSFHFDFFGRSGV
jgi:hypothetical protein